MPPTLNTLFLYLSLTPGERCAGGSAPERRCHGRLSNRRATIPMRSTALFFAAIISNRATLLPWMEDIELSAGAINREAICRRAACTPRANGFRAARSGVQARIFRQLLPEFFAGSDCAYCI